MPARYIKMGPQNSSNSDSDVLINDCFLTVPSSNLQVVQIEIFKNDLIYSNYDFDTTFAFSIFKRPANMNITNQRVDSNDLKLGPTARLSSIETYKSINLYSNGVCNLNENDSIFIWTTNNRLTKVPAAYQTYPCNLGLSIKISLMPR